MSLKKVLLVPLVISIGVFIYYSGAVRASFSVLMAEVHITPVLVTILAGATILQIVGHLVRAYKTNLLFQPVKINTTRFQFRALSIGYVFNTVLPFRLGELIRARIIAGGLNLSFSLSVVLIIIERAFDAVILSIMGLIIVVMADATISTMLSFILGMLLLACLVLSFIACAVQQNTYLLRGIYVVTDLFRPSIRDALRFKAWSVIYGLQRIIVWRRMLRYAGLSVFSWICYGASVFILAQYLLPTLAMHLRLISAAAPYFGASIPAGPAYLGVFSNTINTILQSAHIAPGHALAFNLLSWGLLVAPMCLIGIVLLFSKTKESVWRRMSHTSSSNALVNKLYRTEDISREMARFLENFFSSNTLSHIVHKLELRKNFRLMKYFKGGSDAITILALQDGQEVVKKIIPLEFENRLRAQANWLREYGGKNNIVSVLAEEKRKDFYAIDIDYDPDNVMFLDYLHQVPLSKAKQVIDKVWDRLDKALYAKLAAQKSYPELRQKYVDTHIIGCLEKAATAYPELVRAAEPAQLMVNGQTYDNLYQILEKIKNHPEAWKDIARFRMAPAVHGDVIIDNLLVNPNTNEPLIIDPAPDGNLMNGPVFDFGKNLQSLYCGYEFLLRDESPVFLTHGNSIEFKDQRSTRYAQLAKYIQNSLAPRYLTKSEQHAMLFHAGALYIRRLKHQIYYTPANTLKFYAVGVKTLNDFLAQYDPKTPSS